MRVQELTQSIERARAEAEKAVNPHERSAYLKIERLFERLLSMRSGRDQVPTQIQAQNATQPDQPSEMGRIPTAPQ
ncbi:MAG TPA: hypothetical protein VKW08_18835 [Xanthobacteraceae bacterium]|nr:hypothetical protein [Xanthobacteraceae bacterium]